MPLPTKRNQCSLEKWLNLDLRQEIYEISWEHLVRAESKEGIKDRVITKLNKKTSRVHLKRLHLTKDETVHQQG